MKYTVKYILCGLALMLGMTACVQNLDVTPKDPSINTEFEQDAIFTKIYATLANTGQQGPDGNGDVDDIDEGTSAFYRMFWELNEFPTDEGWWIYGDPGVTDLRPIAWTSTNTLVAGIYYRLYFNITLCNHFLEKASDEGQGAQQKAEVRLLRALNYSYLLDMFGSVPFTDKVNAEKKPQYSRAQLYEWLETELLDLENVLPDTRVNDYRVDKVAAQMILARIYLNAEIYTGTAQWDKAAEYAKKVIDSPYKLHTTSLGGIYTPYQELFMGDNHRVIGGNDGEGIINVYQDGVQAQTWGGSGFVICGMRDQATMLPYGSSDSWTCFRSSPELIAKFVDLTTAGTIKENEFDMPSVLKDDRAIFCSGNTGVATAEWRLTGTMSGGAEDAFFDCWSIAKWTGRYIDIAKDAIGEAVVGHEADFPDTDIPLIRVAEAYLTYAEAVFRGGAAQGMTAEDAVKALRDRAHNTEAFTLSNDFLLDEWCREFYCEGRRRTDLVRFGKFAGETADYNWEGRGGAKSGEAAKSLDKKYNVFPLPESDVVAGNLDQVDGY